MRTGLLPRWLMVVAPAVGVTLLSLVILGFGPWGSTANGTAEGVLSGTPPPGTAAATGRPIASPSVSPDDGTRTFYLAPDGDDSADGSREHPWSTAIRASGELRPGDTLLARGGRYLGQGGYGWVASGTPEAPITFAAAPGETAVFDGDGLEQWLIFSDVHDLVIEDLEITNYRPVQNGVLLIIGSTSDVVLDGLVMEGNASGGDPSSALEHLIYPGAGPVTNLTIRNCVLDASGLGGAVIHVFHDPGPVHLVIEGNAIRNGWWGVIIASDADGVTIRRNRFSGNRQNVEIADAARNVVVEP